MADDLKANYAPSSSTAQTGISWDLYAPESGEFWVHNDLGGIIDIPLQSYEQEMNRSGVNVENTKMKIDDFSYHNDYKLSGYSEAGLIGILVANPENPKAGRVYTLSHMGSKASGELNLPYAEEYEARGYPRYPDQMENRIPVKAGDWIGYVGQRGWAGGPHVHFEVFEYFKAVYEHKDEKGAIGMNQTTDQADKNGFGWRRIDPSSCFSTELLIEQGNHLYNYGDIKAILEPSGLDSGNETYDWVKFKNALFRSWYYTEDK